EISVECGERRNQEIGGLYLTEQERGERIAGIRQNVAARIVSAGAKAAEVESAAGRCGPAVEIELVMPELVANLDRVLAFYPRQIVHELPSVDRLETEADPLHADLCIRNVAREGHVGRAGCFIQQSALVSPPQLV